MNALTRLAALTTAVLILAACGGSSGSKVWNETEIVSALDLVKPAGDTNPASWDFTAPSGLVCHLFGIQTSKQEVDLYRSAGDPVATNPDGTAGVKVNISQTGEVRACLDALTEAMKQLK